MLHFTSSFATTQKEESSSTKLLTTRSAHYCMSLALSAPPAKYHLVPLYLCSHISPKPEQLTPKLSSWMNNAKQGIRKYFGFCGGLSLLTRLELSRRKCTMTDDLLWAVRGESDSSEAAVKASEKRGTFFSSFGFKRAAEFQLNSVWSAGLDPPLHCSLRVHCLPSAIIGHEYCRGPDTLNGVHTLWMLTCIGDVVCAGDALHKRLQLAH